MNYSGKIFAAVAALVLGCPNLSAQEPNPQDTTAAATTAFPEDAPMLRNDGAPRRYYIRDINIRGVKYLNEEILKSSAGLVAGDSIYLPSNFIGNAISRLWSQRFFSDVKIGAEIDGDSIDLEVFLKERPRVYHWNFEGISKGKKKDLTEKLKLKPNSELSDYVIDKNQKLIKKYWAEKGFRNATVDVRIDNDTLRPAGQAVSVTFLIDRKERVKIGRINFLGNEQFKDKRLRRTFKKTHQKSINFFKSAKFKEEDYGEDKGLLIDFYNSKGYRNATIVRDSIYPINEKRMGIDVEVSEGNKYYIRNVSWVGNSVYPTEQLQELFGVRKGDIYDKKTMHKRLGIGKEENPEDMNQIKSLYQNNGYLMSQIEPAETIIGADSIDVEVKVFEGKQFTINEVGITGNQRVDDEVIRRELYVRPGELYDRSLLMQTIRTLGSMGHFNPEAIMPDIKPVSNELVNVNWPLEEQASDQFNIAGGWGSGTFVGSVGITLNNLSVKTSSRRGPGALPDGPEPAAVDLGPDQRHLLQGVRPEFHRPVAGRPETQLVHHLGAHLRTERRLLYLAERHTLFPHVRRGSRSGQASQLARPLLHALRRGELRTLLAQKLDRSSSRTAIPTCSRSNSYSPATRWTSRSIRAAVRSSAHRCSSRPPTRSGTAKTTRRRRLDERIRSVTAG